MLTMSSITPCEAATYPMSVKSQALQMHQEQEAAMTMQADESETRCVTTALEHNQ